MVRVGAAVVCTCAATEATLRSTDLTNYHGVQHSTDEHHQADVYHFTCQGPLEVKTLPGTPANDKVIFTCLLAIGAEKLAALFKFCNTLFAVMIYGT
eukprot:2411674-Amphidinium_carterae.3